MMIEKEVLNFILQDMPESIIEVMFCFIFLNQRLRWKKIFIIAVLVSLINLVDLFPVAIGIRTLLLMVGLAVYIKIFTRKNLSSIFIAVFIVFLLGVLGDIVWSLALLYATHLSYTYVYNNPYLRALFSYPTLLTTLVVTYFLYRYKKKRMINFE